ncbi:MAG: hypothetical protein GY805_33840 [Chloroflexi bacterium]|nr:hypothetical protein [Chloroflexota bacterium]
MIIKTLPINPQTNPGDIFGKPFVGYGEFVIIGIVGGKAETAAVIPNCFKYGRFFLSGCYLRLSG